MKQQLTILGDRQSGRSRQAVLAAICDAQDGKRVLYEVDKPGSTEEALRTASDLALRLCPNNVLRVVRARGRLAIDFKDDRGLPSTASGRIDFRCLRTSPEYGRGGRVDTHVIDDVPYAEPHPDALHVIRVVLR
jgi:hypothetical protein